MKVLVIGGGGREHALVWKIAQSPLVKEIFCAPGNPGIEDHATPVDLKVDDIAGLRDFARGKKIDLTIVGPELPLTLGITDLFENAGLKVFGPSEKAAELEKSKSFTKEILKKYDIPTAAYETFTAAKEACEYLKKREFPLVVKADGLAAGKGVIICDSLENAENAVKEILEEKVFGEAGNQIVIEDFLTGEEVSILVFSDGKNLVPLMPAQDHKAVYDGDKGPNTGGMGAYSPAPVLSDEMAEDVLENILKPVVKAMDQEGRAYKGILYAGLMMTKEGPKVLEFNVRFGDPETQPILMRMESDIVPLFLASIEGSLDRQKIEWRNEAAVCVVMASAGYPGNYPKGEEILGLDKIKGSSDTVVFHAGTKKEGNKILTNGGRVLSVTSLGNTIAEAIKNSYEAVSQISWENSYYRKDIGKKAAGSKTINN